MIDALVRFSLRQRLLVLVAAIALAIAGGLAWRALPIDAFPDIAPTQVKVIVKVPGMTPEEVEQRVVAPIEIELLGLPRKRIVRSMSKFGIADVTVDFDDDVDVYWARQQVSERIAGVMRELPPGATGGLAPVTTPLGEMFMFTIDGDGFSLAEKRRALDWIIRPALRTVPGVADVNALGGEVAGYEVIPDAGRMRVLGVMPEELRAAIAANIRNDGAGRIDRGEETLTVRVEAGVLGVRDLGDIVVRDRDERPVRVADVATVRIGTMTRYGAVTRDGKGETVQGLVLGLRGANARAVVEDVAQRLRELQPRLPAGMTTHVFYDRGGLVSRAANTVVRALVEASVLVVGVLFLFLGGLRAALVVALSLPLTLLATFLAMRYAGLSANLMSLGGLAVALGMLVDAAVVVVESIEERLARAASQPATDAAARSRVELVREAVAEVGAPVSAGVAIIALVFLPLLSLQGLEGKLFAPVALAIVIALAISLVVAFSAVPAAASLVLRHGAHREPWLMRGLHRGFAVVQRAAARWPRVVIGVSVAMLALAAWLYATIGKTFMPTMDEGDLIVQLQKIPSITLSTSIAIDARIQQALLAEVPEIRSIVARTGSDDLGLDPMGLNETDTFLVLAPKAQWRGTKDDIADGIRKVMTRFPGLVYSFTQPIEMRVAEMLTGTRGDVAVKVFGPDLARLGAATQAIAARVRRIDGAAEVIAPRNEGAQYLSMRIDRLAAGRAGFTAEALQEALRAHIEGQVLGIVPEAGIRTPLVLRGDETYRDSPQALADLMLRAPDGRTWPVRALARVAVLDGPVRVDHENGSRYASVQVNVAGRDLAGFVQDAQRAVAELPEVTGLRLAWGGQFENQQRAAARLALVVPIALGAVFLVLTVLFGSARQAVLVIANVPFALVGGIAALRAAGEYLSVPASVGFIALLGIAVLNGVVLISHLNERRRAGVPLDELVMQGPARRLRPVLMTATITALGMAPLLTATGPGSEIQRPLAIVVMGGLVTSTVLTLVMLPMLFARFAVPRTARAAQRAGATS